MVRKFALIALLAAGTAGPALATVIDIDATSGAGTTATLASGAYTVRFIGTASGGAYDAWNPWGIVQGCDGAGANCANGFVMSLAIDLGYGIGNFNRTDGYQYGSASEPGNTRRFSTGAAALAEAQSGSGIVGGPLGSDIYAPTPYPFHFTLAASQTVNFAVIDSPYSDNNGGISISLTSGVPEPASWALMVGGFGLVGATLRRRRLAIA